MKKAEITVYLALVLSIMLSLILTLIEGARISAIRMQIECVTDMGLNSCFAEYHRELLEQYDLLFIDTAYGTGNPNISNTEMHLKEYMNYNMHPTGIAARDFLALEVGTVVIEEKAFATDRKGMVCKKQAINYMKDKTGLDRIEDIMKQSSLVKEHRMESRDINAESGRIENKLDNLKRIVDGEEKKVHIKSPAKSIHQLKGTRILDLLIDNQSQISSKEIELGNYVSRRSLEEGDGVTEGRELKGNLQEEILFGEYLLEHCADYTKKKEKALLSYQLEYILYGNSSDIENLKAVVKKLLFIRQVANSVYLWSDSQKSAEADAAAAGIASAVLMPEIQPLVKASLMFAWAYAESVGDVKSLLEGGKIPLLKKSTDWRLQFSQLKNYKQSWLQKKEDGKGITYSEYLRLLLLSMNKENKIIRFMDIVEMDIQRTPGNAGFLLDGCMDRFLADIENTSRFGYGYQIKRAYCYEQ